MTASFDGQTVIVTGAGHGLGREFALALAAQGAAVVVNDLGRSPDGRSLAEAVVAEIEEADGRAVAHIGSVAVEADANALVDLALTTFDRLDAVINNAGIVNGAPFAEQTATQVSDMLAVHVLGSFLVSRAAFAPMAAAGGGRIVNVTSSAGLFGMRTMASYSAAKAGIVGLMHTMAIEGADHGIKVNSVAPVALTNPGRTQGAADVFGALGPRARPEFVTPIVLLLASDRCPVTNEVISAVAGRYARVFTGVAEGWVSPGDQPATLDELAEHFDAVLDRSAYDVLGDMREEIPLVAARLPTTGS